MEMPAMPEGPPPAAAIPVLLSRRTAVSLKAQLTELDPRAFEETGKAIARWYKKKAYAAEDAEKMARFEAERLAESQS